MLIFAGGEEQGSSLVRDGRYRRRRRRSGSCLQFRSPPGSRAAAGDERARHAGVADQHTERVIVAGALRRTALEEQGVHTFLACFRWSFTKSLPVLARKT